PAVQTSVSPQDLAFRADGKVLYALRALKANRRNASPKILVRQTRPVWVVSLREKIHRYEEAEEVFEEVERRVGAANVSAERAALWHTCARPLTAKSCAS